jgi:hypothetical protein
VQLRAFVVHEPLWLVWFGLCSLVIGVNPVIGLFAGDGYLRWRHSRGQDFESKLAGLVTTGIRNRGPEIGFGLVFGNSTAGPVVRA